MNRAYASLPHWDEGWQVVVRWDRAAYEPETLDHWDGRGWPFAVSGDMTEPLRREVLALAPAAWQP